MSTMNKKGETSLLEASEKPELVWAGVFYGKDIMVTQEVKEVIDYLGGQIAELRASLRTSRDL